MAYKQIIEQQREFNKSGIPNSYEHRRQALLDLKKLIVTNKERLLKAVEKDLRRDKRFTDIIEISLCLQEIDYFLKNLKQWMKPEMAEKTLVTLLDSTYTIREPYGSVLLICPYNYPFSLLFLPLIPIIAAGNTAVLKPSELTPNCAELIDELITQTFKKNFIAVVQAEVQGTIDLLKERYDLIMATSSPFVGKVVSKAAAEHLTPVVLELGGKCPVLIEPDADLLISAKRIIWGKFLACGQTCLAPDYILTTEPIKNQLIGLFGQVIQEFYGKDIQSSPDYSRIVNVRHFDRLNSLLEKTKGRVLVQYGEPDRSDLFIPPTILEADSSDILLEHEIFGPILTFLVVKDFDEALDYLKRQEKPLATYIFTKNSFKADKLIEQTSSGNVLVNDVLLNFSVDTLPFGGVGQSGIGKYRGKYGFETFSHQKSVIKRGFFADGLISARYPPLTDQKHQTLLTLTTRRAVNFDWLYCMPFILLGIFLHYIFQRLM